MKKINLVLFILLIMIIGHCNVIEAMSSSPRYQIRKHESIAGLEIIKNFSASQLKTRKKIWVYLPPGYEQSQKKYPVLYMQQGQNLFGDQEKSWNLNQKMNKLYHEYKIRGIIIVGIESHNPQREFVAWDYYNQGQYIDNPLGADYIDFVAVSLKPYIDSNYRTLGNRENTFIAGTDLGGLAALYAYKKYPHVFSKVAAFSPALWVYEYGYQNFKITKNKDVKIYFDGRKQETDNPTWNQVIVHKLENHYQLLLDSKYEKQNLKLVIINNELQTEKSREERFIPAFLWLIEDRMVDFKKYFSEAVIY